MHTTLANKRPYRRYLTPRRPQRFDRLPPREPRYEFLTLPPTMPLSKHACESLDKSVAHICAQTRSPVHHARAPPSPRLRRNPSARNSRPTRAAFHRCVVVFCSGWLFCFFFFASCFWFRCCCF